MPTSNMVSFVGDRGTTGLAKITLIEEGRHTRVCYDLQAQVRGYVGKGGSRLIEFIGLTIGNQFFQLSKLCCAASIAGVAADADPGKRGPWAKRALWALLGASATAAVAGSALWTHCSWAPT
ncbi:hypothetical protein BZM27_55050, partial [Paraburkholderia steynii]